MKTKRIEQLDNNFRAAKVKTGQHLCWRPATHKIFTIRGLAWLRENKGNYYRLPLRAEKQVRQPVWSLGQCPASAHVAFRTDSARIAVRATLMENNFMGHMPATGSHGLCLYQGGPGQWRPWATAVPDLTKPSYEWKALDSSRKMREFRLYLPLYGRLAGLEIGLEPGARTLPPSPLRAPRPIVFYGTSITQGGCASTPGSDFVSIIGRDLNLEVVNLGFSGNGRGDPELADLMSEIKAALYVLDYAGNVDAPALRRTLPPFVRILRAAHQKTPVLLLSEVCFARYDFSPEERARQESKRDILMDFYIRRRRAGDANIHFADGFSLLPFAADGAYVDGVHPTSHGFKMMAERLLPQIERILMRER